MMRAIRRTSRSVIGLALPGLLSAVLTVPSASAQHEEHARYRASNYGQSITEQTRTSPDDDAVLMEAPQELLLQFPERVRLVKLTLHNETRDWVDIDFRYNPRPGNRFVWALPGLQQTAYYTADWAILGANDELVRGSFSFAFGPDAEPPSMIRAAHQMPAQQESDGSSMRRVSPPPTQIILDQDPPSYDPPFTIRLEEDNPRRR